MNNHSKKIVTAFSGFLVLSILNVSQYHCVRSLPYFSQFSFIGLLFYSDVLNINFGGFLYFNSSVFTVTN